MHEDLGGTELMGVELRERFRTLAMLKTRVVSVSNPVCHLHI